MPETLVLFEINKGTFGMNIHNIVSIEKITEVSKVPKMPEYVSGIVNIRGQIVPVIDMSKALYDRAIEMNEHTRYILVETNETIIAFMVEKTNEIISIDADNVAEVNSLAKGANDFIKGVAMQDSRIITILNLEALLLTLNDVDLIRAKIGELNGVKMAHTGEPV
ncbi:chemotaxis protein CheW [Bacillus sp. T33-2]|uniref:chemotaxis protein CheW n=1 Tax=Bacillus sp. T33-2 TaxID=2054168 RepID=UPI000C7681A7|nr:chemotaxis protein CheW [Bacillus sp. T33-2]PLR92545.1 hypothetical protein CVD19_20000 [Bacillus sp. T33-2]